MDISRCNDRTAGGINAGQGPSPLAKTAYPIAIAGTGSHVPPTVLTSAQLDVIARKPAGWARRKSGIESRHVATTETVIDLAVAAAGRAIDAAGLARDDIDCIIASGAVAHQPIPTSAVLIQKSLGLESSGIPAFDVNATCLGFLAALDIAGALICAGRYRTILITAADIPSRGTGSHDPELQAMFGDGAAAAIVTPSRLPCQGILAIRMETYSEGASACEFRAGGTGLRPHEDYESFLAGSWFEMDGPLAYRVSARHMPEFVDRLLESADATMAEIDLVVPHQASAHALHLMRRKLAIPPEKLLDLLSIRGNQVSASIPSMLDHALSNGLAKAGDIVLLIGTAAGITLGGAVVRL